MRVLDADDMRWVAGGQPSYSGYADGETSSDSEGNTWTWQTQGGVDGASGSWFLTEMAVEETQDSWLEDALSAVGDFIGLDGNLGYDGPGDREWAWQSWGDSIENAWDNVTNFVDGVWDDVTDWWYEQLDSQPGYNPSGDATFTSDQTTSHNVSQEEWDANAMGALAAALASHANSDPASPFAAETTPLEKMSTWQQTHPGWSNQPEENIPSLSDFSPGGLYDTNYGSGSPYSVSRP
ncbi:hypothetical protein OVA03_07575 [Asticcacaulis sp. SL142]|uniref:hypothetical protein n=1 Tax=Asticcacaulis sp. SL142 TaxID=2995155 RepID=UPI00226CB2B3|nr:hypothetical protein [Asticcacaulis sp. SL142]WAC49748.1 hypothetical protein OVA03_07575 [Asticcacaulis sp. SL142]